MLYEVYFGDATTPNPVVVNYEVSIERQVHRRIAACMAAAGFEYVIPTDEEVRSGLYSALQLERSGAEPTLFPPTGPAVTPTAEPAVTPSGVGQQPTEECSSYGEQLRTVIGNVTEPYGPILFGKYFGDERIAAIDAKWAACVAESGIEATTAEELAAAAELEIAADPTRRADIEASFDPIYLRCEELVAVERTAVEDEIFGWFDDTYRPEIIAAFSEIDISTIQKY